MLRLRELVSRVCVQCLKHVIAKKQLKLFQISREYVFSVWVCFYKCDSWNENQEDSVAVSQSRAATPCQRLNTSYRNKLTRIKYCCREYLWEMIALDLRGHVTSRRVLTVVIFLRWQNDTSNDGFKADVRIQEPGAETWREKAQCLKVETQLLTFAPISIISV